MAAALGLEAAWKRGLDRKARRLCLRITFGLLLVWLICVLYGGYVWLLVFPYYRPIGIAVVLLSLPAFVLGWVSMETGNTRRAMVALVLVTIAVKLVHWGYYVPEWNYRHGQGPWGRAIGQWLLPNWTLYTFHPWPEDLALATGRQVRQLRSPQHLAYPLTSEARHVLLQESEFDHWPENAPAPGESGDVPGLRGRNSSACTHRRDLANSRGPCFPDGRRAVTTIMSASSRASRILHLRPLLVT